MIPARIEVLAALPLSASGKTDRGALGAMTWDDDPASAAVPTTLAQQQIGALMGEALGIGRALRPDEDFFLAGGHSLLVLALIGLIEPALGATLRLADVFAAPTPAALADRLAEPGSWSAPGADLRPLLPLRAVGPSTTGAPLFLLPPAGGLGWCYLPLLRHLPADIAIYAVQSEGLDGSPADLPASLDELAAVVTTMPALVGRTSAAHLSS